MRPSFVLESPCRAEDAMSILRERIDDAGQRVEGSFSRKHGVLCMPPENRRFWSPCLDLTIDDEDPSASEEGGGHARVKVWGTFSPRPEIWTGFVFAVGTLSILSILSLFFGVAQVMLGHTPWALLIPLAAMLIALGIYASALIGQGLAGDDMYQMRAYVDGCLGEAEERARRRPQLTSDASSQL
jgi:hypothetical protein